MPIDMNFFGKLSMKEQQEYKAALDRALREYQESMDDADYKLKLWMKDANTRPDDLKALLDYRKDLKKDIDQVQSDLQQIKRSRISKDWDDCGEDYTEETPRDKIGGTLSAGAGVISLRLPKLEKDKRIPTYKEIMDKKKKDGTKGNRRD